MPYDNKSTAEENNSLIELNDLILRAEETGLTNDLTPHLHEDFTIIRANGVMQDGKTFLEAVPKNIRRDRSIDRIQVCPYDDNCAIYTCRVTTNLDKDGNPAVGYFWNTRVYIRQKGVWRCVSWQVTEICQP